MHHPGLIITAITEPEPDNGRITPNPERITELARSIAATGLLNPITVRKHSGNYALIAGRSRLAACRQLGWTTIPATVVAADDLRSATMRLAENAVRSNLSPVEEAAQLAKLIETNPEGVAGVATTIGRSETWILDRLDILAWPQELIQHVHDKKVSLSAAKRLARIQPPELRLQRIHDAATHGINARTAALWLQDSTLTQTEQTDVSELSRFSTPPTYISTTATNCFMCRQLVDLAETQPVRICHGCMNELASARLNAPAESTGPVNPQTTAAPPGQTTEHLVAPPQSSQP